MSKPVLIIARTELKRRKAYLAWWSIGLVLLCAFTVLAYGSIKSQAEQLNKAFASLTTSAGSFFGTSDMFSPNGYLNSQLFYVTLPIIFIILAVTLSGSLVSKEERHRTLELLLSRPVSRAQLLLGKILAADAIVAILGTVTAVCISLSSWIIHLDISSGYILLATVLMTLFAGAFGAIAFMLHAASQLTQRMAAAAAIFLSLGGYLVTSIGSMVHGLAWAAKLFPYHYYSPGDILNGHVSAGLLIYLAAIYVLALIVALTGFRRRDIS